MSENVSGDVGDKLRCNYRWTRRKRQMWRKGAAQHRRSTDRSLLFALAERSEKMEHGVALQTAIRYRRPLQTLPL